MQVFFVVVANVAPVTLESSATLHVRRSKRKQFAQDPREMNICSPMTRVVLLPATCTTIVF